MMRAPRLLPEPVERPVDVAYELWDYALYFAVLAFVGYVIYDPTVIGRDALREILTVTSASVVGAATTVVVVLAAVCSYREKWLKTGYTILVVVGALWAGWFAFGILYNGAPGRAWVSFLIYANIASRGYRLKART